MKRFQYTQAETLSEDQMKEINILTLIMRHC